VARIILHTLNLPSHQTYEDGFIDTIEIKDAEYKAQFASFKNITFPKIVSFENVDLSVGLSFENCTFNGPLIFSNITATGYDDKFNPDSQSLVFKHCFFNQIVNFFGKNAIIERTVLFEDSKFENGLNIEYLNIGEAGLALRSCTINKKLDIFNITTKQDISLAHNTINCEVRIERANADTCTILGKNTFNEFFHIIGVDLNGGIVFNDGLFKKEVTITQAHSEKSGLTIIGSEFEKSVSIGYHSGKLQPSNGLYSFYLSDSKFKNGIYINGTEHFLSENPFVESIQIAISAELQGDIVFRNLHVGILAIGGYNNSANLYFEHLYVNQIKIKGLINNAGFIFSMIKSSYVPWTSDEEGKIPRYNALYIDDSNFGKAQFFQVDFASFDVIVFHNNILTDISTSLVKWFLPEQLETGVESGSLKIYKDSLKLKDKQRIINNRYSIVSHFRSRQEIYRQLKFASQKQGDIPQALEFQRHEMNYYRQIVKYRKPRRWNEYLILWSNQSNNFGQSWLRAVVLFIIFSFVFYIPIGFLNSSELDYLHFARSWADAGLNLKIIFHHNLKKWFVLMNPTHSLKDINENMIQLSGWIYFWDFLSRIIVSYFLFQIISAFRKFNK
jgi:hypothetical protein